MQEDTYGTVKSSNTCSRQRNANEIGSAESGTYNREENVWWTMRSKLRDGAGAEDICLVVGYKYEVVRETILHQEVNFVLQEEQLGTGHAVRCAKDFLGNEGQTMILFGDTPLITAETLKRLREYHTENKNTVYCIICHGGRSDRIWKNHP